MRLARTEIIALANQKGGCGKTSTAVNLAAALAEAGYAVCLVDVDSQCNTSENLGIDLDDIEKQGKYTIIDAFATKKPATSMLIGFEDPGRANLTIIPGSRAVSAVPHKLEAELRASLTSYQSGELDGDDIRNEHRLRLRNSLDALRGQVDFVILDTPPELGFVMTAGLIAADWYIVPTFASGYDLRAIQELQRNVRKVQQRMNQHLRPLGVLLGRYETRTKLDRDILEMLRANFGEALIFRPIEKSVKLREASVNELTIFEHAPDDKAAQSFRQLAVDVVDRVTKARELARQRAEEAQARAELEQDGVGGLLEMNRG